MAESIGEKLRLARETRGIALRDISEQTRISMRYLEAIETDDYRRLPGGIFNRSFIRAYAKFIGYDEQEAIDEYAREQESNNEVAVKPYKSLVYTDTGGSRSPLATLLLAVIILGETANPIQYVGGALILASVVLLEGPGWRASRVLAQAARE